MPVEIPLGDVSSLRDGGYLSESPFSILEQGVEQLDGHRLMARGFAGSGGNVGGDRASARRSQHVLDEIQVPPGHWIVDRSHVARQADDECGMARIAKKRTGARRESG